MTASWDIDRAATVLLECESSGQERAPMTEDWPELTVDIAYEVQDELLRRKFARGEHLIGVKLGLTSRAKQQRMNIDSPVLGFLTDAMVLPAGAPVPLTDLIHPRAEPEIVLLLGEPLKGPGVTAATALAAVERVYAGVEVIDSRYKDYRFTLPDVVADNTSAARFALGPLGRPPHELDLSLEACLLEVDGSVVDSATGSAVQGHPAEALAFAANALGRRGRRIDAGWIVLTGGMTDAVPVDHGSKVAAHFTSLGSIVLAGA